MAGADENVPSIGDWMSPTPSPRTLVSNFLNEDFGTKSFSDFLAKNVSDGLMPESVKQKTNSIPNLGESDKQGNFSNGRPPLSDWFGAHKSASPGGLAERMAASGFSVPKLNTARAGAANMASSSSDMLTIPPGLSPTSLLDSPVFLSNSMVQPSPTTGKFQFAQYGGEAPNNDDDLFDDVPEAFAFKPPVDSHSLFVSAAERRGAPSSEQQRSFSNAHMAVQSGKSAQTEAGVMNLQNQQEFNFQIDSKETTNDVMFNQRKSDSSLSDHSPTLDDQLEGDGDPKGDLSTFAAGTPAEDVYNWRKYGQKQVKGSEYPRSYYKCTHPNCQVKKKVERSHEGHITEIIYKGAHNHPKPPSNRRSGVPSSHPFNDQQDEGSEQRGLQASFDGNSTWASTMNANSAQDWPNKGLEMTSSSLVANELGDPSNNMQQAQECAHLSSDAIDVSSTLSNEEDDRATHGSVSLVCDGEGDETESKRRKLETCQIEMTAASRAVREPRVVVQTTSEVDILDDGYRWRKYGQKVVKGNPNPRSYYKCTSPGCTVRKHVERASHDLKSVITTYEGKHNHDVPAARSSGSNPSSASSNTSANLASQPHSVLRRVEPAQDGLVRFDGHPPLGLYGLSGREHLGPLPSGFSFASQTGLTNLTMAGLGPVGPMKMPVLPPVHSYMGYHQSNGGGFVIPKGEPKEEAMPDSRLPMPNGDLFSIR